MNEKSGKHQTTNFKNLKDPLPALSFQDIKVVFANSPTSNPTTTVVMSVPYYYDLLSPQGIRDWNSQRAATIEQEYVTTIKKDSLVRPGSFQAVIQPVNEFKNIDMKVSEIMQYANTIEQDLNDLGIPQLTEKPHVEPLFADYSQHHRRVRIIDDSQDEDTENQSTTASHTTRQFSKAKISNTALQSTERAREKVKIAEVKLEATYKSGLTQKKKSSDSKARPIANEERGKYNWTRINQLMQEDTF